LLEPRPKAASREDALRARRRAFRIHLGVAGALVLVTVIIWATTGHGYFWPEWVILPLALLLAIHAVIELAVENVPDRLTRGVAVHGGVVVALFLFLTAIWAVTTRGDFWPGWALLGLAGALGV